MFKKNRFLKLTALSFFVFMALPFLTYSANNDVEATISAWNKTKNKNALSTKNNGGNLITFKMTAKNKTAKTINYDFDIDLSSVLKDSKFINSKHESELKNGILSFGNIKLLSMTPSTKEFTIKVDDISSTNIRNIKFGDTESSIIFDSAYNISLLSEVGVTEWMKITNESDGTNAEEVPVDVGESIKVEVGIKVTSENKFDIVDKFLEVDVSGLVENAEITYMSTDGKQNGNKVIFGPINTPADCDFEQSFMLRLKVINCTTETGEIKMGDITKKYKIKCAEEEVVEEIEENPVEDLPEKHAPVEDDGPALNIVLTFSVFLSILYLFRLKIIKPKNE